VIRVPGRHELHRLADRRPAMYEPLIQPHHLTAPGRGSTCQNDPVGLDRPKEAVDDGEQTADG
jgi:hypothetical protein